MTKLFIMISVRSSPCCLGSWIREHNSNKRVTQPFKTDAVQCATRQLSLRLPLGLPLPGYALLETKGRKTGKPRRTPVGDGHIGNQFWLVAEHGMKAGYVRNIERDPHVRLKLRDGLRIRWHTGTAHLLSDDDPRERQRWLASRLPSSAGNARAVRLFGTQLLTVRIDLDDRGRLE
jgi:deazaflavin-dependent oxidoreductase (nitroreductase family)